MNKREARKPPVVRKSAPRKKKTSEEGLPLDTMKEGSFRKSLKLNDADPSLKISEIRKLLKTEDGKDTTFRGKKVKMTPLMRKRGNLAITLINLPKKVK
jgi:hypothetical protein